MTDSNQNQPVSEDLHGALLGDGAPASESIGLTIEDDLLERYAAGTAAPAEREIVELECVLSPARAAAVDTLHRFAREMDNYDWASLEERLVRVQRPARSGPAAAVRGIGRLTDALIRSIALSVETLSEPLRVRTAFVRHATDVDHDRMVREPLIFNGDQATGSFSAREDTFQLHIEHNTWPAGTLALLQVINREGEPVAQHFGVFRDDWERTALDIAIPRFDSESCTVSLAKVDSDALTDELAEWLARDCRTAVTGDPDAAPAWDVWATARLAAHPGDRAAERIRETLAGQTREEHD